MASSILVCLPDDSDQPLRSSKKVQGNYEDSGNGINDDIESFPQKSDSDDADASRDDAPRRQAVSFCVLGYCLPGEDRIEWIEFKRNTAASNNNKLMAIECFRSLKAAKRSVVLFEETQRSEDELRKVAGRTEDVEDPAKESALQCSSSLCVIIVSSSQHPTDIAAILEAEKQCSCIRRKHRDQNEDKDSNHKNKLNNIPSKILPKKISSTSFHYSTIVDRVQIENQCRQGKAIIVPPSRSKIQQNLLKLSVRCLFNRYTVDFFAAGPYRCKSLSYFSTRRYPNVNGYVALTIDDVPGRFPNTGDNGSLLPDIQSLLRKYNNSKATFFLIGNFIKGYEEQLVDLLKDGHEFGNHGGMDMPHDKLPEKQFLTAVDDCSNQIRNLQHLASIANEEAGGVTYFRSPHGRYTKKMEHLIQSRNLTNVMCDAYAADPIIEDSKFIATTLIKQARSGGIMLLHTPEQRQGGFRDYCLTALEQLLQGLQRRNLKVVSVGMLEARAKQSTNGPN